MCVYGVCERTEDDCNLGEYRQEAMNVALLYPISRLEGVMIR